MPRIQRPAIEPNIEGIAALLTSVVAFDAKGRSAQLLKVHARVWILSRLAPKRFGEKPEPDDELIRDCDLPQSGEFFSIFVRGHTNGESRWPGDFGHLQAASETEAAELIFGRPTLRSIPAARRNRTRYSMAR